MKTNNKIKKDKKICIRRVGLISSAGIGCAKFWDALKNKTDLSGIVSINDWPKKAKTYWNNISKELPRACLFPKDIRQNFHDNSVKNFLTKLFLNERKRKEFDNLVKDSSLGIIFTSSKGNTEDYIWNENFKISIGFSKDPYQDILNHFINLSGLKPKRTLTVSNACTSSHTGVFLAKEWLDLKVVDKVLILSGDFIGPFIVCGFSSLRSLTQTKNKPFDQKRDGLQLGEAAGLILLERTSQINSGSVTIEEAFLSNEGHAVTRPSESGTSLKKVCEKVIDFENPPEVVIAHGTGTKANDKVEDNVFHEVFKNSPPPIITSTKGSVGHCLGASGSIDIIGGHYILKKQEVFPLTNTKEIDSSFKNNYLCEDNMNPKQKINSILITSLGFGGINAALVLKSWS